MAAGARAETAGTLEARRVRGVWLVLTVAMAVFIATCALVFSAGSAFLSEVTSPQSAQLEPRAGAQLVVKRNHTLAPESVTARTTVGEGDAISTGEGGGAFLTLFDGSTVQLYFDTEITLERLRTSSYLATGTQATIVIRSGTIVMGTARREGPTGPDYRISSANAVLAPGADAKVRVQVQGQGRGQVTSAAVDFGSAVFVAYGREASLGTGALGRASAEQGLEAPLPAEEDLVRNGGLTEEPTSGAELTENGGLGTAGWLPIRSAVLPAVSDPGTVEIVTEEVGDLGSVSAAQFSREGEEDRYAQVGMRQEINRPVEFLENIELRATVKVVRQSIASPGPRGDLFPLTIRVIYRDGEQRQHEWKHSFYLTGETPGLPDATRVDHAVWRAAPSLTLKSDRTGLDIYTIEAIEVYGFGRQFQSSITRIELIAK